MGKFDFNNSRYARFWSDSDIKFLQTFVDEYALLDTNYNFGYQNFKKASNMTPTAPDGTATFTVKAKDRVAAPMADMRAPLGDSTPLDKEGIRWYSATIPDFIAPGIVEQAMEREYKAKLFEQFGNDRDIVMAWVDDVQTQVDSMDATHSNLSAQLLSKGWMKYDFGRGIKSVLHKADIPTENFVKAGTKVWTDPACLLLDQLIEIEQDFRDRTGFGGSMKWQVTKDMFLNIFLKNDQVKDWVMQYRTLNDLPWSSTTPLTEELFRQAITAYPYGISPIEIVIEKQKNLTWEISEMVHGWEAGVAVLRPTGFAGETQYTDILDQQLHQKYGSKAISKSFAQLQGGLYTLVNTTLNNGNLQEWHTDVMGSFIPSLTEFPYHIIVDTTTAG